MNSFFDLSPEQLEKLDAKQSVEIFRDLLWCYARKYNIPSNKIHITSRITVSDGGIDAKIDDSISDIPPESPISGGITYQIKSGTTFKPWAPKELRKELFGKSRAEICLDNLDEEVRLNLEQGNKYIIVSFGTDPTVPQIRKAQEYLKDYFEQCGFKNSQVEVWGQTHIIGLIKEFPSMMLKILGKSEYQFQTLSSWANNDDMTFNLELGDKQKKWINDIREALRNTNDHLRIIGEPGIGKSRLILEALSVDDLAPNVIYIPYAENFQKSQLFNELLRTDIEYHVILVIDECSQKERASIWNALKAQRSRCQLITIDHGPEKSSDEVMRVFHCPVLENEQIAAIINNYIENQNGAKHWASWCSGSPRVAHAVGQNLKQNSNDIFKSPAIVSIWERFVVGYEYLDNVINQQRWTVLRHIALFLKFGFESPVNHEAQFIAKLASKVDPAITWGKFQSIVKHFKDRRILQGKTTLHLVPKALHVYLWLDYWNHYGIGFNLKTFLKNLPGGLLKWFTRMFIYAHANTSAQKVIRDILAHGGLYDDDEFAVSEIGTSFLSVLAEADNKATLRCIERTYGNWEKEQLKTLNIGRQNIVRALEKIAVWKDSFRNAAYILLKMGAAETSNYLNNASGTFAKLFTLGYGLPAPTEASPAHRLPVLKTALKSEDIDEKKLGLKACKVALSIHGISRIIGTEYQGLKSVANLWQQKTSNEIIDAYREVWNLLFKVSRDWSNEERKMANELLIDSARDLVEISSLSLEILTTIEVLSEDPATTMYSIVDFILQVQHLGSKDLSVETLERIKQLDLRITGTTLEQHIERYVLNTTWSEDRLKEGMIEKRIINLAEQVVADFVDFLPILEKLVHSKGIKLYEFAFEIAKRDKKQELLPQIIEMQRAVGCNGSFQFIGGYLRAFREEFEEQWEKVIAKLSFNTECKEFIGQLLFRTGVNENIVEQMLQAYKAGNLIVSNFSIFEQQHIVKDLSQDLFEKILFVLLKSDDNKAILIALKIAGIAYRIEDKDNQLSEKLIFDLLTTFLSLSEYFDKIYGYYWQSLATRFLITHPEKSLDLFEVVMSSLKEWYSFPLRSTEAFHYITKYIAKNNPTKTWNIVQKLLETSDTKLAHGILYWLGENRSVKDYLKLPILAYFPVDAVLNWVNKNVNIRAPMIASVVPKSLDKEKGGQITRELLRRYGDLESVKKALFNNFFTDGFYGLASEYYKKKHDKVREWLDETEEPHIVDWLEEYIDKLTFQIEKEEIREEREF